MARHLSQQASRSAGLFGLRVAACQVIISSNYLAERRPIVTSRQNYVSSAADSLEVITDISGDGTASFLSLAPFCLLTCPGFFKIFLCFPAMASSFAPCISHCSCFSYRFLSFVRLCPPELTWYSCVFYCLPDALADLPAFAVPALTWEDVPILSVACPQLDPASSVRFGPDRVFFLALLFARLLQRVLRLVHSTSWLALVLSLAYRAMQLSFRGYL